MFNGCPVIRLLLALILVWTTINSAAHLMPEGHASLRLASERGYFVAHLSFLPKDLGIPLDEIDALVSRMPALIQLETSLGNVHLTDVLLVPDDASIPEASRAFTVLGSFPYEAEQTPQALIIHLALHKGAEPLHLRTTCVATERRAITTFVSQRRMPIDSCQAVGQLD